MGYKMGYKMLSNKDIKKSIKEPGKLRVAKRIYLVTQLIKDKLYHRWIYRYQVEGNRKEIYLGPYPDISAKEASLMAEKLTLDSYLTGTSPADEIQKKRDKLKESHEVVSSEKKFRDVVNEFLESQKEPIWKKFEKEKTQAMNRLENYPSRLLDMPIDSITRNDIRDFLMPIWLEKHATANKSLGIVGKALDWAIDDGRCSLENNPALSVQRVLPSTKILRRNEKHLSSLYKEDLPILFENLEGNRTKGAIALRGIIFTALRSGDLRAMKWEEIDWKNRCYRAKIEKRTNKFNEYFLPTPLPHAFISDLRFLMEKRTGSPYVFSGTGKYGYISDVSVSKHLKKWGFEGDFGEPTLHGFRSTFTNWQMNTEGEDENLRELQLTHVPSNKVRQAYERDPVFLLRRDMMDRYAEFAMRAPGGFDAPSSGLSRSHLKAIA